MTARALATATIAFGRLRIPVKLYSVASPKGVSFHQVERETGARVKQQRVSSVSGKVLSSDEIAKAYEYAPGQLVQLTAAELEHLEDGRGTIEITATIPPPPEGMATERCYHLGPEAGAEYGYRLLATALFAEEKCALACWKARKDHVVVLWPQLSTLYAEGWTLKLVQLFHADELNARPPHAAPEPDAEQLRLARELVRIAAVRKFALEDHRDQFSDRVRELVASKVGAPDLAEVLEASMPKRKRPAKPRPKARRRAAASG